MVEYTEGTGDTLDFIGATEYTEPTGTVLDFELVLADRARLPVRTLTLSRNAPTATGAGTATATNPARTIQLSRGQITVKELLSATLPGRTLELSRAVPEATGAGTVEAQAPSRTVQLSRSVPRAGFVDWVLDGAEMGTTTGETATHRLLTLTLRAESDTLSNVLRPLKSDEGQVATLPTDSGGYVAVDRADGGNTFDVIPPAKRQPLRRDMEMHVQRYEESMVSQTVEEWDVTVELVPAESRDDTPDISETRDTGEWAFDTRYGQIVTQRVDAEFVGVGEGGVEQFELTTRLEFDQAHVFEAAMANLEGVRIRSIPDATNEAVDDTGGTATVTVTSPATDDVVADGDYVVIEFESTRLNDRFQSVTMRIADEG
jgi:hypothetical protein